MNRGDLIEHIFSKQSYLVVGLDTDIEKIPRHLVESEDPMFEFNRQIIDATRDNCIGYKINTAFYEAEGLKGWQSMMKTVEYIPKSHFTIADAKRGDIGNTANMYARAFFENMNFDSITVNPYMGEDSVKPFLQMPGKWAIVLGLTSNSGSEDIQQLETIEGPVYKSAVRKIATWGTVDNLMFVAPATKAAQLKELREIIPDHFLLVPGIGAQGGSLMDVSKNALTKECGMLVNSSRAIIYASDKEDFADAAAKVAAAMQKEMKTYL